LSIASAAAAAAYRGEAPYLLSSAGLDLSNYGSGVLAASVTNGDKVIESLIRDAATWLGMGVATAVNLLLPDIVVLGGGLIEAMPDLILDEARKSAQVHVLSSYKESYKIVPAKLGDDAAVMGAAAYARYLSGTGLKA